MLTKSADLGHLFCMEFIYKIEPVSKLRPVLSARNGFARAITKPKTRNFEAAIAQESRLMYKGDPLDVPLAVSVKFFITRPPSAKRKLPNVRPDLENFIKSVFDGCNGIIWKDDSLICRIEASKEYSTSSGFIVLNVVPIE